MKKQSVASIALIFAFYFKGKAQDYNINDLAFSQNHRLARGVNLIIAVHYYSPIQFTHQGTP